jgi:hypothetical protein
MSMAFKIQKIYSVAAAVALSGIAVGCSSSSDSSIESGNPNPKISESSTPSENSNSKIDEEMLASVECVVTELETNEVSDIQEIDSGALITVKADVYFYYDEVVTVTNYTNDARDVYLEYRYVDANGNIFGSSNFSEILNAGETATFTENKILKSGREIVLSGDTLTQTTSFDCPVVEVKLY